MLRLLHKYFIEVNSVSDNKTRVLYSGYGSHLCMDMQSLKNSRQIKWGESDLRVENVIRVEALVIGIYILVLPSKLILELENCYYVAALTKNIIVVSCLSKNNYHLTFKDNY